MLLSRSETIRDGTRVNGVTVGGSETICDGNAQINSVSMETEEPPDERDLSKLSTRQKQVWGQFIINELKLDENKL